MLKFLLTVLTVASTPLNHSHATTKDCQTNISREFEWIKTQIEESTLSNLRKLKCPEQLQISSYSSNDLTITSGRVNRKSVICLSDKESNPCKHVIADLEIWVHNPPVALQEIFNLQKSQTGEMFETVERLFIKPSALIR